MAYLFETESGSLYEVREGRVRRYSDHEIGYAPAEMHAVDSEWVRLSAIPEVAKGARAHLRTRAGAITTARVVTKVAIP